MFAKVVDKIRLLFVDETNLLTNEIDDKISVGQKILLSFLTLSLLGVVAWILYTFCFVEGQEKKFLSLTYISGGKRPYVDFFAEKHEFMLFLFLPIIEIFNGSTKIFPAMRIWNLLLLAGGLSVFCVAVNFLLKENYIALRRFLYKVTFFMLATLMLFIIFWFAYTFVLLGDEREHLTSCFYIYNGQHPYVDFFEHHHPLLWYAFLPFMGFFYDTGSVWYALRTFELVIILINAFVVFKIAYLIIPNKGFSLLAAVFSLCSHVVFVAQITFRPDALMSLLMFCGLYLFFKYMKDKDSLWLYVAFIFFFFAFMALQKVLMFLFFIALLMLYLVYKKELSFILIVKSLIIPMMLFLCYLFYLYQIDGIKDYFELNYLLNIKARYLFTYPIRTTIWFYLGNVLAFGLLFFKTDKFIKYVSVLCLCFSVTLFLLGTFAQYWIPMYSLLAIVSAYAVFRLNECMRLVVMIIVFVSTMLNNLIYIRDQKLFPYLDFFVGITNKVLSLTSKNDVIIGNLSVLGGLRNDATGYYWFGRDYMAVIDNHYFNRHPLPNINEIIKTQKPKIIPFAQQIGCTNDDFSNDNHCNKPYIYDMNFLYENYIQDGPLFIRKGSMLGF